MLCTFSCPATARTRLRCEERPRERGLFRPFEAGATKQMSRFRAALGGLQEARPGRYRSSTYPPLPIRFVAVPSIRSFCGPSRGMQKCITRSKSAASALPPPGPAASSTKSTATPITGATCSSRPRRERSGGISCQLPVVSCQESPAGVFSMGAAGREQ